MSKTATRVWIIGLGGVGGLMHLAVSLYVNLLLAFTHLNRDPWTLVGEMTMGIAVYGSVAVILGSLILGTTLRRQAFRFYAFLWLIVTVCLLTAFIAEGYALVIFDTYVLVSPAIAIAVVLVTRVVMRKHQFPVTS